MSQLRDDLPIFYSFRRCPYAIRARMAIAYAGVPVQLREVVLKHKPDEMLAASPKGTVPVLLASDSQTLSKTLLKTLEQSLDIMHWAIAMRDEDDWIRCMRGEVGCESTRLLDETDGDFKRNLDRYKYADRHPDTCAAQSRQDGEVFLQELELRLKQHRYLFDDQVSFVDVAIFPFVRQFAHVDREWFYQSTYTALQVWLDRILTSTLFLGVMKKYPAYDREAVISELQAPVVFPDTEADL
ncbi:MAG: glutathione S-transferase [Alteromonadaceae bacterium]|nr:MAG: glutathione S-transferase [Alteromonadaceae bacterium]